MYSYVYMCIVGNGLVISLAREIISLCVPEITFEQTGIL
jgi:hypothetical protein